MDCERKHWSYCLFGINIVKDGYKAKSAYSFVGNVQTVLLVVGANSYDRYDRNYDRYDRNYDRYDRNYDRYDRNYDRYDRNYDCYDHNYDCYDRNYNRLKIKFLLSFWSNYPLSSISSFYNKTVLGHTYKNTTNFSQFFIVCVT